MTKELKDKIENAITLTDALYYVVLRDTDFDPEELNTIWDALDKAREYLVKKTRYSEEERRALVNVAIAQMMKTICASVNYEYHGIEFLAQIRDYVVNIVSELAYIDKEVVYPKGENHG